jgi:hypothetical protein
MSASDDALIIRKLIQSLEANISELDIELGEEAPLESPPLDTRLGFQSTAALLSSSSA